MGMKLGVAQNKHHCWCRTSAKPGNKQGGLVEQVVRRPQCNEAGTFVPCKHLAPWQLPVWGRGAVGDHLNEEAM